MTTSIPLRVSATEITGAAFQLPDTPDGITVLRFDQGRGYSTVHAGTPDATATWLEDIAQAIRDEHAQQRRRHIHTVTKVA